MLCDDVQVYLEHVVDAMEAVDSLEGLVCGSGQGEGSPVEGVALTRAAVDFNHLQFLVSHTGDHTLVRGLTPVSRGEGKGGKRGGQSQYVGKAAFLRGVGQYSDDSVGDGWR